MRCRICGKQIPNGALCDDCYKEAMGDKVVSNVEKKVEQNDDALLMKISRKFLPKYQIFESWELLLFSLLVIIYSVLIRRFSFFITAILLDLVLIAISFFVSKRIAVGTKCYFYENKVVYKFNFLFIHKKIVYKYSDIQDIVYNQRFLQKKFNMGNIAVVAKKSGFLYKGFVIDNVANVSDTFEKLVKLVGTKIV